ncbi:putative DNA-binding pseudobarrel domain superfamily [Helianthus debilis subsp. tardiflorus]
MRQPSLCRVINRSDELLMPIPSDDAATMWGVDKGPTNVLIETNDGRTFTVFISVSKGKFFLFNGWSDVVTHLRLTSGGLVILNPLDCTKFKLTYCVNGVIPECILPKSHDYTLSDLMSTIYLSNKTFHVKIETAGGKVCFTNGIDVIVSLYQLEAGCYFYFTKWFGYSFHLTIFGKNGVEMNFDVVNVDEVEVAPVDCVKDSNPISDDPPVLAEQEVGRYIRFVRMVAEDFMLPDDVSAMAKLHLGLKSITIRLIHLSPSIEFPNGTRREMKEKGYALRSWSRFMNTAGLEVGDTVYFCFDELEQVLIVERVVPHIRRT